MAHLNPQFISRSNSLKGTFGGIETYYWESGQNTQWKVHTFESSGVFIYADGSSAQLASSILQIGGGGSGAPGAGAGGAGGMLVTPSYNITPGEYNIIVGAGGPSNANGQTGTPSNGIDSQCNMSGLGDAIGGGMNFTAGGSGGGGGPPNNGGGSGIVGQGHNGGNGHNCGGAAGGGGGGGAGQAGTGATPMGGCPGCGGCNGGGGGRAGDGLENDYRTGSNIWYAGGGGGGGGNTSGNHGEGAGGQGGGGAPGSSPGTADGVDGTGGGGHGSGSGSNPGSGGSGLIVIRVPDIFGTGP